METETGYNGWKNYETWLVALWIDNEQAESERWHERAQELLDTTEGASRFGHFVDVIADADTAAARADLADEIKDAIEELVADALPESGLLTDLLSSAVSSVDWRGIAAHYMDEKVRAATPEAD